MFSRDPKVTDAIRKKTTCIEVSPGSWLVRFPLVNAVFFETEDGVVVVDTGMAGAGPVLVEQIREVMHGKPISDAMQITTDFNFLADALEHIETQVIAKLNAGYRQDKVIASLDWPEKFAIDLRLATYYVSPKDVGKMFMRGWTGWWDDQPRVKRCTCYRTRSHICSCTNGMRVNSWSDHCI